MCGYDIYEKYVACPFYVELRTDAELHCEGVTNDCLSVKLFEDMNELKRWFRRHCCRKPEMCPVYRGIIRAKYDTDSPPLMRIPKHIFR